MFGSDKDQLNISTKLFKVLNPWTELKVKNATSGWINIESDGVFHFYNDTPEKNMISISIEKIQSLPRISLVHPIKQMWKPKQNIIDIAITQVLQYCTALKDKYFHIEDSHSNQTEFTLNNDQEFEIDDTLNIGVFDTFRFNTTKSLILLISTKCNIWVLVNIKDFHNPRYFNIDFNWNSATANKTKILCGDWFNNHPLVFSIITVSEIQGKSLTNIHNCTITDISSPTITSTLQTISSTPKKWVYSPNGKYLITLTNTTLFVYDTSNNEIYSKTFLFTDLIDVVFAHNSSYFILYTLSTVLLFNAYTFEYKKFTEFNGNISGVAISKTCNNVYLITNFNGDVHWYVWYNKTINNYTLKFNQSFNSTPISYIQAKYTMGTKAFYLLDNIQMVVKVALTRDESRWCVLVKRWNGENEMILYKINSEDKNVNFFDVKPVDIVPRFSGYNIVDFSWCKSGKNNLVYINWDNKTMSRFAIGLDILN